MNLRLIFPELVLGDQFLQGCEPNIKNEIEHGRSMSDLMNNFLIFQIDDQHFALTLLDVERVVRAVEVTPLPSSERYILGVVDVQGSVLMVVNTRKVLGTPEKELELSDQFIILKTPLNRIVLVADSVIGIAPLAAQDLAPRKRYGDETGYIDFAARFEDSIVLVINPDKLIAQWERSTTSVAASASDKNELEL
jgi:purine-binding chemotaxis protein CheW